MKSLHSSSHLEIPGRTRMTVNFSFCGLCLASKLHIGRIKRWQSLKTFPFKDIERLCSNFALLQRTIVSLATQLGSITSRCSGKEPALLPQTHGWTREDSFVSLSKSVTHSQIFVGHKLSLSRIAARDGG